MIKVRDIPDEEEVGIPIARNKEAERQSVIPYSKAVYFVVPIHQPRYSSMQQVP